MRTRTLMAMAVTAILMLAPAARAQQADAVQMLRDREAIEALLFQYAVGLDTLNPDLYAGAFAEDAEFIQGETVRKGRTEIRKVITGLIESRAQRAASGGAAPAAGAAPPAAGEGPPPTSMHHVVTNSVITLVDANTATHRSYWMTVLGRGERKFEIAAQGSYEDLIVKQGGKWLFKSRRILR